jgi:hypothetical protein
VILLLTPHVPRDGKAKAGDAICEIMYQGDFSSVHRASFLDEMVPLLSDEVRHNNVSFGHKVVDVKNGEGGKNVVFGFANGMAATVNWMRWYQEQDL